MDTIEGQQVSPTPQKKQEVMTFPEAMQAIIDGKRVARVEWDNEDFCFLDGQWLSIRRNGVVHAWQVNDGDMLGTDWVVVEVVN